MPWRCSVGRIWWRSTALLVLSLVMAAPSAATAAFVDIGSISFDQYASFNDGTFGGDNIIAHYTLNASAQQFAPCFTQADIRWLQLVNSSTDTGFTPTPNRPFIDPRSNQPGGFDNLPWYDATYNNLADAQNNANRQFGAGPYLGDTPQVLLTRGPYSFTADSLVVVQMNNMIAILGGFEWGFTIGANQMTVTPLPIKMIGDTPAIRTAFNTALGLDFPGYTIKDFNQIWPTLTNVPTVSVVPEPSSLALVTVGALALVPVLRARRRAA